MNYYPFHIGDYAVRTRHLSLMEDLAYRRLIDLYYTRESPLPKEIETVARLIGMRDHSAEVRDVLGEFFTPNDDGDWSHSRCDEEIAKVGAKADVARENGKRGGRPPKQEPRGNPEETQSVSPGLANGTDEKADRKLPKTQDPRPKTHITPLPPEIGGAVDNFQPEQPKQPRRRRDVDPPITVAENPQYLETKARLAEDEAREVCGPPAEVLAFRQALKREVAVNVANGALTASDGQIPLDDDPD